MVSHYSVPDATAGSHQNMLYFSAPSSAFPPTLWKQWSYTDVILGSGSELLTKDGGAELLF